MSWPAACTHIHEQSPCGEQGHGELLGKMSRYLLAEPLCIGARCFSLLFLSLHREEADLGLVGGLSLGLWAWLAEPRDENDSACVQSTSLSYMQQFYMTSIACQISTGCEIAFNNGLSADLHPRRRPQDATCFLRHVHGLHASRRRKSILIDITAHPYSLLERCGSPCIVSLWW